MSDLLVTLIQSELHWESIDANIEMFDKKISSITESTDLIVLPEMFTTGFTMNAASLAEKMDGKAVQWMKAKASEKEVVITGSLIIEEGGRFYNRMIWMRPDGSYEIYNKRHLFRLANEQDTYAPGNERKVVHLNGWNICLNVCYDLRFPVWSRNKNDYDVIIYIANWPERRALAWKSLLKARAIENLSYSIGLNRVGYDGHEVYYSGDSAVIHPVGKELITLAEVEQICTIALSKEKLDTFRKKFAFHLDADRFHIEI